MLAIILSAGNSSRFGAITNEHKSIFSSQGSPTILESQLLWLKECGCDRILLVCNSQNLDSFAKYIHKLPTTLTCNISFVVNKRATEFGSALSLILPLLKLKKEGTVEDIWIIEGDVLPNAPALHLSETSVLVSDKLDLYGVGIFVGSDGYVNDYVYDSTHASDLLSKMPDREDTTKCLSKQVWFIAKEDSKSLIENTSFQYSADINWRVFDILIKHIGMYALKVDSDEFENINTIDQYLRSKVVKDFERAILRSYQ